MLSIVFGVVFWIMFLDNLIFMGLLHTMLNFWLISWFKLMDIFRSFEMCGTLFHIYISLYSVLCRLLWFVPMPCSLVLVVLSCITLSTLTLVP